MRTTLGHYNFGMARAAITADHGTVLAPVAAEAQLTPHYVIELLLEPGWYSLDTVKMAIAMSGVGVTVNAAYIGIYYTTGTDELGDVEVTGTNLVYELTGNLQGHPVLPKTLSADAVLENALANIQFEVVTNRRYWLAFVLNKPATPGQATTAGLLIVDEATDEYVCMKFFSENEGSPSYELGERTGYCNLPLAAVGLWAPDGVILSKAVVEGTTTFVSLTRDDGGAVRYKITGAAFHNTVLTGRNPWGGDDSLIAGNSRQVFQMEHKADNSGFLYGSGMYPVITDPPPGWDNTDSYTFICDCVGCNGTCEETMLLYNDTDAAYLTESPQVFRDNMPDQLQTIIASGSTATVTLEGLAPATTLADLEAIDGETAPAANMAASALGIVKGTVSGTPSTVSVPASDLPATANDIYNGRAIVFTSGDLIGEAARVTDYNGSGKALTVTTLSAAPTAGDTFVVV